MVRGSTKYCWNDIRALLVVCPGHGVAHRDLSLLPDAFVEWLANSMQLRKRGASEGNNRRRPYRGTGPLADTTPYTFLLLAFLPGSVAFMLIGVGVGFEEPRLLHVMF